MRILSLLLFLFPAAGAFAQLSGGLVAGMNFSRFSGPSEVDGRGRDLEEYQFNTGFHVGGRFNFLAADLAGLRGELLYAQKGTEYRYGGQSYWIFISDQGQHIFSTGTRRTFLRIVNHYIEIPLMGYLRTGRLEIGGGGYLSYMLSAGGAGDLLYDGVSENGFIITPFSIILDFNFFNDPFQHTDIDGTQPVQVDGQTVQVPESIGAQYFVVAASGEQLFRRWDYGLIGNLALYLNRGLHLGFRLNYGLQDLTRKERDIASAQLDENNQPILRSDFDRNVTLQASIGFGF